MPSRILAIDIGTSSTKGLLVDAAGGVVAAHTVAYPLLAPRPEFAEQDPLVILAAVREVIERVAPTGTDLVFGCAMHGVLAVDADGTAVSPLMTWADRRSAAIAEELRGGELARGLHERTGTPIHPMSPLCKIRHIAKHDPGLFSAADRFVSIKEFVIEALTGERCVDQSVASSTGLFDVRRLQWDAQAMELAGIDADRLSALVPTRHVIRDAARDRDLVVGATDGVLANLGVGAGPGMPCVTLGTSGAARLVVERPQTDPDGKLFCYVLDAASEDRGQWVIGGAINNGGLVLRWLRDEFTDSRHTDEQIIEEASVAPPGADGLVCVPSITGERYPTYRAVEFTLVAGREDRHDRAHLLRAGLEGMMLAFAPLIQDLEGEGKPFEEIRIGGGMFEWAFCRQLLADVVNRRVAMPASRESSGLGGARLGFRALGEDHEWEVQTPFVHEPDPAAHAVYAELLDRRGEILSRTLR